MKKIIMKCVVFCTILLIILLILSRLFVPKNNTRTAGIAKNKALAMGVLAEPENTIDALLIGDSESYTSFIPLEAWHEYGYTSYVCGTPAQKLSLTGTFIYDVLKKQSPKVIMIEMNTMYRRASLVNPLEQVLMRMFPAIEYHNRWKKLTNEDFSGKVDYRYVQPDKGFYYSTKIESAKNEKYMKETETVKKVPRANRLYLKLIKDYCESKGIEVVLYSCPSIVNWDTERHNGIVKLAKELNLEYIDLNVEESIKIDWEKDSRDEGDHLNFTGSLKTTRFLAEYLGTKNLPDHRSDKSYNSWNEYYKKYIDKVNKNK